MDPSSWGLSSLAKPLENSVCDTRDDGVLAEASQPYQFIFPEGKEARTKVKAALHTCWVLEFSL